MPKPDSPTPAALVVVDDQDAVREIVTAALRRRFGNDYEVFEANSAAAGANELQRLHGAGNQVAIIISKATPCPCSRRRSRAHAEAAARRWSGRDHPSA